MHCIVTAGPTYEPIDQVRRLTNHSTGQLGTGLAKHLDELCAIPQEEIAQDRYDRFRKLGTTVEKVVHLDEMSGPNDG